MTEYSREDWEAVAEFYEEFATTNRRLAKLFMRRPDRKSIVKQSEALADEYEYHARAIRARIGAPIDIKEDEKVKHMRVPVLLLIVLLALLLMGTGVVVAQEATREPGELATLAVVPTQPIWTSAPPIETGIAPEPTRVPVVIGEPIVLQPGETNTTLYIVTVIVVTVGCGAIVMIQQRNISALLGSMNQVLTDKAVRDEAERKYMESSLSVQHAIQFLGAAFQYAGNLNLPVVDATVDRAAEFIKDITDGNPNTGQALTAPKVPQYDEGAG